MMNPGNIFDPNNYQVGS